MIRRDPHFPVFFKSNIEINGCTRVKDLSSVAGEDLSHLGFKEANIQDFQIKQFDEGQVIFHEGVAGYVAYILKSGSVRISFQNKNKQIVLATIKPVTVFGEMVLLLENHTRTATATAVENSELVEISKGAFDAYIKSSPPVISTVIMALAERLQRTNERAIRVPNILEATTEILNMLVVHDKRELPYSKTVKAISSILVVNKKETEKVLTMMDSFNLLEIKPDDHGQKTIYIAEDIDFPGQASKMFKALNEYSRQQ